MFSSARNDQTDALVAFSARKRVGSEAEPLTGVGRLLRRRAVPRCKLAVDRALGVVEHPRRPSTARPPREDEQYPDNHDDEEGTVRCGAERRDDKCDHDGAQQREQGQHDAGGDVVPESEWGG